SNSRTERCHASTQYSIALFAPKNGHGENAAVDFFDPTSTNFSGIIASQFKRDQIVAYRRARPRSGSTHGRKEPRRKRTAPCRVCRWKRRSSAGRPAYAFFKNRRFHFLDSSSVTVHLTLMRIKNTPKEAIPD